MEELARSGIVSFRLLDHADASVRLARRIMYIQANAYYKRYPRIDRRVIDEICKTRPEDLEGTLKNMRNRAWYWVAAFEGNTMQTFGVFERKGAAVHVVELHTEPKSGRRRLGSTVLLLGLDYARRNWGVTRATLAVDQAPRGDRHPRAWYSSIGFNEIGKRGEYLLGGMKVSKYDMQGSISAVCRNLGLSVREIGIEV